MISLILFLVYVGVSLAFISYRQSSVWFEIASVVYFVSGVSMGAMPVAWGMTYLVIVGGIIASYRIESCREWIDTVAYEYALKSSPKLSKTEEDALSVGDVWLEADIFIGEPNTNRFAEVKTTLTEEEASFLAHEVTELCQMIDEWQVKCDQDLPKKAWDFIKEKGFLGMVIAKAYGGLGFSARAHSEVVMKIASHSPAAAVTVMVPNSLGPGELLHYYGTEDQKKYYLPRLAKGIDIPCFALTEPMAGSDATSIQSEAIVRRQSIDGKETLLLDITVNKRWITLAPVATLIGLAVNLKDPDKLLTEGGEEGITCVLIGRDTKHLHIGNRHLPANQGFMNGTIRGEHMIVPITAIIGGIKNAGKGWRMLVECLSIGRSISLPALSTASSGVAYLGTSAYAKIRRQFSVDIASFEGVQEKLAEIGGKHYLINAMRLMTLGAVNAHKKPSVASAITKYFNTELSRQTLLNGMDVHAGRSTVTGPNNYLFPHFESAPISITVEGANIMSRNLLIFGQGAMACHPFIREEFYALNTKNKDKFVSVMRNHLNYSLEKWANALIAGVTNGYFIQVNQKVNRRYYQQLQALSRAFAWLADFSLMYLGSELKRRENLSSKLADAMSYLYLAMSTLCYFESSTQSADEQTHLDWAVQYCFYHAEAAMLSVCKNYPSKWIGWGLKIMLKPFGATHAYPSDTLSQKLAKSMVSNQPVRDALKHQIYLDDVHPYSALDKMEQTFQLIQTHEALYKKVKDMKKVPIAELTEWIHSKVKDKTLTQSEGDSLLSVEKARWDAIQVDEFLFEDVKAGRFETKIEMNASPFASHSTVKKGKKTTSKEAVV